MTEENRRVLGADEQFCQSCGETIKKAAEVCPKCGVRIQDDSAMSKGSGKSEKSFAVTLILAIVPALFGISGIHRFYVGKIGTGILMLLTFGGLGIWAVIDVIIIAVGSFTDSEGLPIKS